MVVPLLFLARYVLPTSLKYPTQRGRERVRLSTPSGGWVYLQRSRSTQGLRPLLRVWLRWVAVVASVLKPVAKQEAAHGPKNPGNRSVSVCRLHGLRRAGGFRKLFAYTRRKVAGMRTLAT